MKIGQIFNNRKWCLPICKRIQLCKVCKKQFTKKNCVFHKIKNKTKQ